MNKLIELHQFAVEQMNKWGLIEENWTFVWDNKAVRRYGQCRYSKKEIGVTKKLALINSIEESKDVVLHEIAHALTGSGHGHDWVWKQKCVLVGARPERCYKSKDRGGNVNTIEGKYKLVNNWYISNFVYSRMCCYLFCFWRKFLSTRRETYI